MAPIVSVWYMQKCEAPKRAHFLMIFCEREGCCTKPFAIALRCCLCGAKSVTYALNNLQRMAYCFGCLPLITSIYRRTNARHLKAVFYVQILANMNEVVCHTASECLPKDVRRTDLRQQISAIVNGYARAVTKRREKAAF